MELHFDDLDGDVKNYYYSFVLCNEDWTPAEVTEFDYIKGFSQVRLDTYTSSSVRSPVTRIFRRPCRTPNCLPFIPGTIC